MMAKGTCCMQWEGILELLLRQPRVLGSSVERTLRPASVHADGYGTLKG